MAEETKHAPLSIGYSFSPSQYQPGNVNVPTGAGALWAQVGETAMRAGKMLQESNLNPVVRAQGLAQIQASQQGIAQSKFLASLPHNVGRYVMGVDAAGNAVLSPPSSIADPTLAAAFQGQTGLVPKAGGGGQPPAVNNPAQPSAGDQGTANQGPELTGQEKTAPAAPAPKKGPPTTKEMGSASTDHDFLLRRMMEERAAAGLGDSGAAPESTPSDLTFVNPATGNVEPKQQVAPSMFAGRAVAAPAAPVPSGAPPQPAAQTPAAATQADQAALAQWQAQNIHPVVSPSAVKDALIHHVSTKFSGADVTYLSNGGVKGEPAYGIDLKGGGHSTLSLSQLTSTPWGKSLILGENVMQAVGSQQPDTNQPGNMLLQPQGPPAAPAQPYPAIASDQGGGGPPAAPGVTDIYGNPLSAYTNVPSQGGPANLTAQNAPAGQPTEPGQQTARLPIAKEDVDAAQAKADAMPEPAGEYKGDRRVEGAAGPYTYYRDDNPASPSRGRVYTVLPGPAGHYYDQQKWYPGKNEYQTYELPDSAARQQMWDKWGVTGFLPRKRIDTMTPEEMEPWLRRAWQNEHLQNAAIDQGTNANLDVAEKLYKNLTKIRDIQQTLAEHGYPELGSTDLTNANLEGGAETSEKRTPYSTQSFSQRAGTRAGSVMGAAAGMDRDSALAIRTLDQLVNETQTLYDKHPELFPPGKTEGLSLPNVHGEAINIETPNIKPSSVLGDVFSGQDLDTKLTQQNALRTSLADRYNSIVDGQHQNLFRVQDKHDTNSIAAAHGQDLHDDSNLYKTHDMPRSKITTISDANARLAILDQQVVELRKQLPTTTTSGSANANASPTPERVVTDQAGYDALGPGDYYRDRQGGLHQKPR